MAKAVVTVDVYSWMTPIEGRPGQYQHNSATRGDTIEVDDTELKRGLDLGALAKPGSTEASTADATPSTPTAVTDEQLSAMSAQDVVTALNNDNTLVDRVAALEAARDKPRVTVTNAVQGIKEAQEAAAGQ